MMRPLQRTQQLQEPLRCLLEISTFAVGVLIGSTSALLRLSAQANMALTIEMSASA